jgi:predicted  nucleic acid-binding Zn-ribbon protein
MAVGSWVEWSQHVLHELERLDECYKGLEKKHTDSHDCIKGLKLTLQQELEKVRLEQAKIKTKIAVIVAILTTVGNGLLYGAVKLLWPIFFG